MSAARAVSKRSAVGRVAAAGVPSLAVAGVRAAAPAAPARAARAGRRAELQAVRSSSKIDVDELVGTLSEKWDAVENKGQVGIYAGGAFLALWFSTTLIGAINAFPLLPRIMELVGLGYTSWFVYRYLLFKDSRDELASDVEGLKDKISSTVGGD